MLSTEPFQRNQFPWPDDLAGLDHAAGTDLVEEIVTAEGIDCGWQRNGHLYFGHKRAHFATMQKSVAWHPECYTILVKCLYR